MSDASDEQPLEVWRGAVIPWRCDEMGHMNMRYYLAIAEEGLATVAAALGQPQAFTRGATSTLQARSHHVRFLREARAADSLYTTAGVLELGDDVVRVLQVIRHADGTPAASVVTTAAHVTADGRAFPWSARAIAAAGALTCTLPDTSASRSLPPVDPEPPSLARAQSQGLCCIARGAVGAEECDAWGQMTATGVFGRVSDGAASLFRSHRTALMAAYPGVRIGGAALEYTLEMRRHPRQGELIEVRSGFTRVEAKVVHLRHWLLDPIGGDAYGVLAGVGASLDLDTRKIIPIPEALRLEGLSGSREATEPASPV